jgi:hypothetical protein
MESVITYEQGPSIRIDAPCDLGAGYPVRSSG